MLVRVGFLSVSLCSALFLSLPVEAKDISGLKEGKAELKSAGPLAFGPEGILFVADPLGASIFAVATGDTSRDSAEPTKIEGLDAKVAAVLGTSPDAVLLNDLAVNPASGKVYLSVSRGRGTDAVATILTVSASGEIKVFSLEKVKFSKAVLPNAPDASAEGRRGSRLRLDSITDMDYVDGKLIVAGLSNEEFASTLRSIPFPFEKVDKGSSVEIYHGAHGRFETRSPVRTFVPFEVEGQQQLLAAYTCTPLVRFPVSDLKPGAHIKGTTVAELGNRNRPLDMITYRKDGKDFLLLANSSRGIMKITTAGIEKQEGITEHVPGGGTKGQTYESITDWQGIDQLAKLDDDRVVVIRRTDSGKLNLEFLKTP